MALKRLSDTSVLVTIAKILCHTYMGNTSGLTFFKKRISIEKCVLNETPQIVGPMALGGIDY